MNLFHWKKKSTSISTSTLIRNSSIFFLFFFPITAKMNKLEQANLLSRRNLDKQDAELLSQLYCPHNSKKAVKI